MKNSPLKFVNSLILIVLAVTSLSSCVAKKKFVAMESSRDRAESRVKELTNDVASLQTQFNQVKVDFHASDNTKNKYIDSLEHSISALHVNLSSKEDNIEGQEFSFQVEKRRLSQLLIEKDKQIRSLTQQVSSNENEIADIKDMLTSVKLELQNNQSASNISNQKVKDLEKKSDDLNLELKNKNTEILRLKEEIAGKNTEIEKLNNNVKLLKSQIGQNK